MAATHSKGVPILPSLVPQLEYLKLYSPIPLRVEHIRKGHHNAPYLDRFTVFVPCCLDHVKWDVLFSSQNSELAPDFIFGPDDQDFQPLIPVGDEQVVSSTWALLREWTPRDPSRLLRLLMELRSLYLRHQRKRVEGLDDPQVKFEIGTISAMEGLEMRLFIGGDRSEEVQFALPLDIDLTYLSRRLGSTATKLWGGISLQVTFNLQRSQSFQGGAAPQLKLHAPPALKDIFDVDDVKLPTWADRMCLMEYIPNVQDVLTGQVRDAITSIGQRKIFVEAVGQIFGRPLEVESVLFRRFSVIATSGLFCFLIHFLLPTNFPKQQPTLTFQSSQHFDGRGKPILLRYTEYPWSPRWEANHMAQRIFEFAVDECDRFKKHCTDTLQQGR
ncbi:unnamed protein product [Calypogeia fissa]